MDLLPRTGELRMAILSKPSTAARTSLIYITVGALMDIWSAVWWWYLRNHQPDAPAGVWYICGGLFLTGLVLLAIGLLVGHIGRSARHAELPPPEVTKAEAIAEQNAAARAPIVAPVAASAGVVPGTANGLVAPTAATPVVPHSPPVPGTTKVIQTSR
jgi:hypothetical protein